MTRDAMRLFGSPFFAVAGACPGAKAGALLVALLPTLGCRPAPTVDDPAPVALAPPPAEVVATLDAHGTPPDGMPPSVASIPPAVARYGPDGVVDVHPQLFVRFTHAMQPVTEGAAAPTFTLDPPIGGTASWVSAYSLVFDLVEAYPVATRVNVRATGDLVSATGEPVRLDVAFAFETERPEVTVQPLGWDTDGPWHWKAGFGLKVDDAAALPSVPKLRRYVRAVARPIDGKGASTAVPVVVRRASQREREDNWWLGEGGVVVLPRDHWPADRIIEVVVDKALPIGNLTLGRSVVGTITTQPGIQAELDCVQDFGDGCDPGPLNLRLSTPVMPSQLRSIHVTPRPPRLKVELLYASRHEAGESVRISGRFEAGKTYRIHAGSEFHDVYGQALAAPLDQQVAFVLPPPEVSLLGSHGTLPAKGQRTVGLETRWVKRVRVVSAVLQDDQLLSQFLREPDALRIPADPRLRHEEIIDLPISGALGWSSREIDLAALTGGERRPVMIEVEPVELMPEAIDRPAPTTQRAIYQQTDLGAVSLVSPARTVTRVSSLATNAPVRGVKADLYRATTTVAAPHLRELPEADADGLVELPRSSALPKRGLVLLHNDDDRFATRVGELYNDRRSYGRSGTVAAYQDDEQLISEVVTERPLYRPGEVVHIIGFSAVSTNRDPTGLRPLPAGTPVELTLTDDDDEDVAHRTVATKASGKYWGTLTVPPSARLGRYRVNATIEGETFRRWVRVKDFRTPTFMVRANADRGDVLAGASVNVAIAANYYFGGDVPIESLTRSLRCTRAWFRPVDLDDTWMLAGVDYDRATPSVLWGDSGELPLSESDAASGRTTMTLATDFVTVPAPFRCVLSLGVRDVSMQDVGAEADWLVHPERYLAVQRPTQALQAGKSLRIPVRAVDFHGVRRADGVKVEIVRHHWVKQEGGWKEQSQRVRTCAATTTTAGDDAGCTVTKLEAGRYEISAEATAGAEPRPRAAFSVWVGPRARPRSWTPPEKLTVTVSNEEPEPGDTVTLRIAAPQATGQGVVALLAGGVRRVEPFSLVDGEASLDMVVDQSWVPRLQVRALLPSPEAAMTWARMQSATADVVVREAGRGLVVAVDAPATASPNETIEIALKVRDAKGNPTAANVSVWAVDEAVLSLGEPVIPDLVRAFIVDRGVRTSVEHDFGAILRPYHQRGDPYTVGWAGSSGSGFGSGSGSGFGGGGAAAGMVASPPSARERFETTPIFIGDVALPASGEGVVRGQLPENLTTFRITAIASAQLAGTTATARFGHAEDRTRLTVPLALRVVTPRVMRPGDEATLAAVVDNLGGPAGTLEITLELADADGLLRARGPVTETRPIAAGSQVRVPFRVVARGEGTAPVRMRVVLVPTEGDGPSLHDAMQVDLPVQRERTLVRQTAVYGSLTDDQPVAVRIAAPPDRVAGTGAVDVRVDTSLLAGLQDVARDLVEYPYGCVEQTSSGLVPLVALGELAITYPLGIDDVDTYVQAGVARLGSMQTDSGGFGYWPGSDQAHLYGTAYAVWVLEQARLAGHPVSERMLRSASSYLVGAVEAWADREATTPHDDIPIAMALHALALRGVAPTAAVERIYGLVPSMPTFARAVVVMMLHQINPADRRTDELVDDLASRLEYRGGGAHVRDEGAIFAQYFDSEPRTHAMVLLALATVRPDHRAVEPLARGLMALRQAGRIRNTQENAYALLGLAAYARQAEVEVPRLTADAWIGDTHAISRRIEASRFASEGAVQPLGAWSGSRSGGPSGGKSAAQDDGGRVTIRREGQGRLYYRVGMAWTPDEGQDKPEAAGLAVATVLRTQDGVVTDGTAIAPGTLLTLDVQVTADARTDYVAVDIPLPAGLEAIDMSIGKGRSAMVLPGVRGRWASHEEIRFDRALLFADRLRAGTHTHTLFLRATTPGTFEMPPTVAQSMYFPEIAGHTARRRVVIAPLP